MINKERLREKLLSLLYTQRQNALDAADTAHDLATHEQSVAETQYDTAYFAHGQSQRVADFDVTINRLIVLPFQDFNQDDEIKLGTIVSLSGGMTCWFLPVCKGHKLEEDKIVVITPQSPLGRC